MFRKVSVLESDERFIETAKTQLKDQLHRAYHKRLQEYRCEEPAAYDLIWVQWVAMYASDDELFLFLEECIKTIKPGTGLVGFKENTLRGEREPDVDLTDHSVVRSDVHFRRIFKETGLEMIDATMQKAFPEDLYPVRMYLLKPKQI